MSIIFTSPKGGNGTTVTAAAYALLAALRGQRTVLIDLCGDQPATVGMTEPTGPGVNTWLSEHHQGDTASLLAMGSEVMQDLLVIHRGSAFIEGEPRWSALAEAVGTIPYSVVIDAGVGHIPQPLSVVARHIMTVVKPCYLTLRRATELPRPITAFVVAESGRALTTKDVVQVLGAHLGAEIPYEPAIARAVDAGLLPSRVEQLLGRHITTLDL